MLIQGIMQVHDKITKGGQAPRTRGGIELPAGAAAGEVRP
jgi:hypothetical protein